MSYCSCLQRMLLWIIEGVSHCSCLSAGMLLWIIMDVSYCSWAFAGDITLDYHGCELLFPSVCRGCYSGLS